MDAAKTQLDMYKTQVDVFKTRIDAQRSTLDLYRAEIEGYNATLSGERTKVEAYNAYLQGQRAKIDVNVASINAFSARVKAQTDVLDARVKILAMQGEGSKMDLERYKLETDANVAELDGRVKSLAADVTSYTRYLEGVKVFNEAQVAEAKNTLDLVKLRVEDAAMRDKINSEFQLGKQKSSDSRDQVRIAALSGMAEVSAKIAQGALSALHVQMSTGGSVSSGSNASVTPAAAAATS
jgi:uncharacterized protein YhaN